ncbi:MAG: hypothetical protein BWZ00_00330 [Bacteroidetes bacterium ADurb.BinA174]|jgi:hypothetical protein|nr:MAG: hypothetical protein BWZ00_00330 [Bacteroidetes bacterium ADurb.BinA174]
MIVSFKNKETENIWKRLVLPKKLKFNIQREKAHNDYLLILLMSKSEKLQM